MRRLSVFLAALLVGGGGVKIRDDGAIGHGRGTNSVANAGVRRQGLDAKVVGDIMAWIRNPAP